MPKHNDENLEQNGTSTAKDVKKQQEQDASTKAAKVAAKGAATYFGDWEFRYQILRTAEMVGGTKKEKGMRHYKISNMFLVGEATVLAMRTNIKR